MRAYMLTVGDVVLSENSNPWTVISLDWDDVREAIIDAGDLDGDRADKWYAEHTGDMFVLLADRTGWPLPLVYSPLSIVDTRPDWLDERHKSPFDKIDLRHQR
jgi:hypothetical protein